MAGKSKVKFTSNKRKCLSYFSSEVEKGIDRAAAYAVKQAKTLVPVDTGKLKASIKATTHVVGDKAISQISASMDYAAAVELGTRHQKAQPFLRPAISHTRQLKQEVLGK